MARFNLFILIAVLFATSVKSQTERPNLAFGDGEKLEFILSYRAKMWPNTDVGDVVFTVSRQRNLFTFVGHGTTRSFFRWFYELDQKHVSVVDASTLKPITATERTREKNYRFDSEIKFDWSEKVVQTSWRKRSYTEDKRKTMSVTDVSADVLTHVYRLRNTDESTLRAGVKMPLDLVFEDTIRRVYYKFVGREEVSVSGLGRFRAFKFSCTIASQGDNFDDGAEFFVWISDDRNRMPLRIEMPIKVGSVRVRLAKYSGLRHPVDSKIK